jgi:hypothetical protein
MGLDIYLYRYENKDLTESLEEKYNKFSEENWNGKKYEDLTDHEKETLRSADKKYAAELGLDEWGDDKTNKQCIEMNSEKYPEHLFKIGYFRSSYNDGGINRILLNLGLPTLSEIFGNTDDVYKFTPDWIMALINVRNAISQLKQKNNLRCFDVSWNDFRNPKECKITDEQEAMSIYLDEKTRNTNKDWQAYSNLNGHFYHSEPIKVYGLINGVKKMLLSDRILPCTYVICEGENQWYVEALEIVEETIEYVLAQDDKDKYLLHWSG